MASRILDQFGRPFDRTAGDGFALPHVWTYSSVLGSAWQNYWHDRADEARRSSREDAEVMENDPHLMRLMQERKLAVATLPWHLEVPNERDPKQIEVRDKIRQIIAHIRGFRSLCYSLLDAIWYGKMAAAIQWQWRRSLEIGGGRYLTLRRWYPINGDKLTFQYNGMPAVLGYAPAIQAMPNAKTVLTTNGMALLLTKSWRERFFIHHHEARDADWMDADKAEARFGVGVRSVLFLLNWMRLEWLANVSDYMERVGLGLTIWYYDAGDPQSKIQAETSAKEQSGRVNLLWPRGSTGKGASGSGIDRIEVPTSGAEYLLKLQQWVCDLQELYVVGQTLSSKSEGSGLGGTGVADLHADTKAKIAALDAERLAECLTGDDDDPGLVSMIQRYTFPDTYPSENNPSGFPIRFVFDVERSESKEKLDGARTCHEMGIDLKADEVRAAAGYSKPDQGDEIVPGAQSAGAAGASSSGGAGDGGAAGSAAPAGAESSQQNTGSGGGADDQQWSPYRGPRGAQYERNLVTGSTRHVQAAMGGEVPEQYLANDWVQESGPRGGTRWRNTKTGNISYRKPSAAAQARREPVQGPEAPRLEQHIKQAQAAWSAQDQDALARTADKVRRSMGHQGMTGGEFGHGGLQELARTLGVANVNSKTRKSDLAAAILAHLGHGPAANEQPSATASEGAHTPTSGAAQPSASPTPAPQATTAASPEKTATAQTPAPNEPVPSLTQKASPVTPKTPSETPKTPPMPDARRDFSDWQDDQWNRKQQAQQQSHQQRGDSSKSRAWNELNGRLQTAREAEKRTGIPFSDRVINGLIGSSSYGKPDTQEGKAYAAAQSDPNKSDHAAFLKAVRANFADRLKNRLINQDTLNSVLSSIETGGYGKLKPQELHEALQAGGVSKWQPEDKPEWLANDQKNAAAASRKQELRTLSDYTDPRAAALHEKRLAERHREIDIRAHAIQSAVPHIDPAKAREMAEQQVGPAPERPGGVDILHGVQSQGYRGRLKEPLQQRLDHIARGDKLGTQTFLSRVLTRAMNRLRDAGTPLPNQDRYDALARTMNPTDQDKAFLRQFRAEAMQHLLEGAIPAPVLDRVLVGLSDEGLGSLSPDELRQVAAKAYAERQTHPDRFGAATDEMVQYAAFLDSSHDE